MTDLRFEWDPRKALANERKHGISFEEAKTTFSDEFGCLIDDPDHSGDENRFLLLGLSARLRAITVSHCFRQADDVIRIISARKATKKEQLIYIERRST